MIKLIDILSEINQTMKKLELKQIIKEEIYKILNENTVDKYLIMASLFTDKDGNWENKDWSFDPLFKTQGLIAKYGKGANGQGWGKPVILCSNYNKDDPFTGSHDGWQWAVVFKKNINEIYIDDEIFDYGKYSSEDIEKQAVDFIVKNGDKGVSLGTLHNKFKAKIAQDDYPYGNYVLNIKPNEIIKIVKRNKS